MKSHYCQIVFVLSLLISYFLVPKTVFYGFGYLLAGLFMLAFSMSLTCIIRNIKEKVKASMMYKESIAHLILIILGLSALQVCGVGAPVCGATVGLGILSIFLPSFVISFLSSFSSVIIILSALLQLFILYYMKCFTFNYSHGCKK